MRGGNSGTPSTVETISSSSSSWHSSFPSFSLRLPLRQHFSASDSLPSRRLDSKIAFERPTGWPARQQAAPSPSPSLKKQATGKIPIRETIVIETFLSVHPDLFPHSLFHCFSFFFFRFLPTAARRETDSQRRSQVREKDTRIVWTSSQKESPLFSSFFSFLLSRKKAEETGAERIESTDP